MSEIKTPKDPSTRPEFMTLMKEVPEQGGPLGDLSDVFWVTATGEVKINPGSGNFAASEAAEKKHLIGIRKADGNGFTYHLTSGFFKEPTRAAAVVTPRMREVIGIIRKQDEKQGAYDELHEIAAKLGFDERFVIAKQKPGVYQVLVRSAEQRTVADVTIGGSLKELTIKLKNLSKIFLLLKNFELEGRYKLIDGPGRGQEKGFILYIFPEEEKKSGVVLPEEQFEGDAVALWMALQKKYGHSARDLEDDV